MPVAAISRSFSVEYAILRDVRPAGPVIGFYAGQPIADCVVDSFGELWVYRGVAGRTTQGAFDMAMLGPGEFIVLPGLVYRRVS